MRTHFKKCLVLLALSGAALLFPTWYTISTCRCCLWTANQLCEQRPDLDPHGWYKFTAWGAFHIGQARRGAQERKSWEFEDVRALRIRLGLFLKGITLDVVRAKSEWHMVVEPYAWLNVAPAITAWLLWLLWCASRRFASGRSAPGQEANRHADPNELVHRAGITRRQRIALMVLVPPLVGGAMLVLSMPAFISTGAIPFLQVVPVALLLAFLFGVPPSLLFALIMEVAFTRRLDPRRWAAPLLATALGATTGVGVGAFVVRVFRGGQTGGIRVFLVAAGAAAGLVVALAIRAGTPPASSERRG
jgi:hypothetical protein